MNALIQWGMTTADPAVIRHCLGMMLSIAEDSPDRVIPLLQTALSDPTINNAILADALSSSTYVRLCWCLYESTKNNDYLKVVCSYAQQSTEAASLLAMELLCSLPYSTLSALNQAGDAGNGGSFLIPFLTYRITS